jgi:hypothetical protein
MIVEAPPETIPTLTLIVHFEQAALEHSTAPPVNGALQVTPPLVPCPAPLAISDPIWWQLPLEVSPVSNSVVTKPLVIAQPVSQYCRP